MPALLSGKKGEIAENMLISICLPNASPLQKCIISNDMRE